MKLEEREKKNGRKTHHLMRIWTTVVDLMMSSIVVTVAIAVAVMTMLPLIFVLCSTIAG